MTLIEGIFIVVVILLTITILRTKKGESKESTSRSWDCVDRTTGELTTVNMQYTHGNGCPCPRCSNLEKSTHAEHSEFFACGGTGEDTGIKVGSMCADDDQFQYAVDPFGAPDMEYKDWVTSQSVDTQVIKNHSEFVKDRFLGNPSNVTGRTYSPDYHDSYDPVPWIGIRGRPQAVSQCNPTQVPDMDINLFVQKPKFIWSSS